MGFSYPPPPHPKSSPPTHLFHSSTGEVCTCTPVPPQHLIPHVQKVMDDPNLEESCYKRPKPIILLNKFKRVKFSGSAENKTGTTTTTTTTRRDCTNYEWPERSSYVCTVVVNICLQVTQVLHSVSQTRIRT